MIRKHTIPFKRKHTWISLFVFIILGSVGAIFFIIGLDQWNIDQTKSSAWLTLAGIILQTAGFFLGLKPDIIKITSDKESNLQDLSIGLFLFGTMSQGLAISKILFL